MAKVKHPNSTTWRETAVRHQVALAEVEYAYREMGIAATLDQASETYVVPFAAWQRLADAFVFAQDALDPDVTDIDLDCPNNE